MRTLPTALALCLLLALPAAQAGSLESFTASSVQAVGPDAGTLQGELAALAIDDSSKETSPSQVPPFLLEAEALHIETDEAPVGLHGGAVGVHPIPPATSTADHKRSTLQEVASRDGHAVDVVEAFGAPPPQAMLSEGCYQVGALSAAPATDGNSFEESAHVNDSRKALTVPLQDAASASPCGQATVTVTGSFSLRLWEADVLLGAEGSSHLLRTGRLTDPALQGQPVKVSQDVEAYITVHNGTLTMPLTPHVRVYLRAMQASLDGPVVLTHVHGRLETPAGANVPLNDQTVQMRGGPLRLRLSGHGTDPLQVNVEGPWSEARYGDVTLVAAPPASRTAAALPGLLGLLAMAGLAAARRRS